MEKNNPEKVVSLRRKYILMRGENQKMKNGKFYNPKIFKSDCFEYLKSLDRNLFSS